MLDVYISTTGNDTTGDGSLGNPYLTLAKAVTELTSGGTIWILSGTYNISSTVTFSSKNAIVKAYDQTNRPLIELDSSADMTITSCFVIFNSINFNKASNSGQVIRCSNTIGYFNLTDCDLTINTGNYLSIANATYCYKFKGTRFLQSATNAKNLLAGVATNPDFYLENCQIIGNINVFQGLGSNLSMTSCLLKGISLLSSKSTFGTGRNNLSISYCTFIDFTALFSAGFGICQIKNNFFHGTEINSSGTDIEGIIENNVFTAATDRTNFISDNDTNIADTAAALFYDEGANDYRIDINSPLVIDVNDTAGAFIPHWDSFWSDVPEDKVEDNFDYRVRSRVNNKTGTLAASGYPLLDTADVKIGVDRGDGADGTYDGSDRHTDPGIANVRSGTAYKSNSTTNNRTGTLDIDSEANLPLESDVEENAPPYGENLDKQGTLHIPVSDNVLATELKIGVVKTINDVEVTGTYTGAERNTDPGEANVREGTTYKIDEVSKTGLLDINNEANLPDQADVRENETYGENAEFTGTLNVDAEANVPPEDKVVEGTTYGENLDQEGTAVELDLNKFTDVPENKVENGFDYKYNSDIVNRTGSSAGATCDYPDEWKVLKGVEFDFGAKEGKYDLGDDNDSTEQSTKIKILQRLENKLYFSPEVNSKFQNTMKLVVIESGKLEGIVEDDLPMVQVRVEDAQYDNTFILSGNRPKVTLTLNLEVTCPANWKQMDAESLYEDIRQAIITDDYSFGGLAINVNLNSFKASEIESESDDKRRVAEASLTFTYIEQIEQD